jgi:hypothetical protein
MRLTLRTLLAYMDNMLEPADAEALRAKIEESEFAKVLMARIEAAVRQPRLSSLPLDEKGLGLDANSIAQYLDNTLAPELVPELEQFLLQSDMQLAEVAACHQALASILDSEPITSPELRHRVRCLGSPKEIAQGPTAPVAKRAEYGHSQEAASHSLGSQPSSAPTTNSRASSQAAGPKPTPSMTDSMVMTDPLRPAHADWTNSGINEESSRKPKNGLRIFITLALAALLVLAAYQAIGPFNRLQGLWTSTALAPEGSVEQENNPDDDSSDSDNPDGNRAALETDLNAADNSSELKQTTGVEDENPATAATSEKTNNNSSAGSTETEMPAAGETSEADASKPDSDSTTSANTNPSSPPKPEIPLGNVQVATWNPPAELAQGHLLFINDQANRQLIRVTSATTFPHGTRLLIAPGVRNSIQVNHDVAWSFYTATDFSVSTDSQMPWITMVDLTQGKAVLQDSGKSSFVERQPQTLLRNGNTLIALRWSEPNSAVAVEATPMFVDPSRYDPQYVGPVVPVTDLRISVLQGKIEVSSVEITEKVDVAKLLSDTSGFQKLMLGDSLVRTGVNQWEGVKIDKAPTWIETPLERPIDRQAASDLMQLLPAGARANLVIVEALQNRRAEIAALAAQTLILSDDFSFLAGPAGLLNDDRFRSHWTTLIDAVRERISSSPESLEALKVSLATQDVQRGALLFQVLVGYSEPELKLSAAERLVNLLESEFLDERILAIYQLKRITGKDLGFQPDRPSRGLIQDWKRLWRTGGIPPKL